MCVAPRDVNSAVRKIYDGDSVCGRKNLAFCVFPKGVHVGDGNPVVDTRFNQNIEFG